MDFELLLLLAFIATVYLFWIELNIICNFKIDSGWILALGLFFDIIPAVLGNISIGISLLFVLIVIPAGLTIPAIIKAPSQMWKDLFSAQALLWIAFLIYSAISLIWSTNFEYGKFKLLSLIIRGFIPGISFMVIYKKYKKLSWSIIFASGLVYVVLILLLGKTSIEYPGRIAFPDSNPIIAAQALLVFLTIALFNTKIPLWLKLLAGVLCVIAVVSTQSRGPIISFVLACFLVISMTYLKSCKNSFLRFALLPILNTVIIIGIFGFTTGIVNQFAANSSMPGRLGTLINTERLVTDSNFVSRVAMQKEALRRFSYSSFIGEGLGSFAPRNFKEYPHNIILEIASEEGALGLIIWFAAVFMTFKSTNGHMMLKVLFVQTIFYSLFSGNLGSNYEYMLIGMAIIALMQNKTQKNECEALS